MLFLIDFYWNTQFMLICMESLNYDAIVLIKSTDAREMVAFLSNFQTYHLVST